MKNIQTREEFEEMILKKADDDDNFSKAIVDNPKAALNDFLGISVPEKIKLFVHQEKNDEFHIILPEKIELTDKELDNVSGGTCWSDPGY
jgi:hypothetical protein